MFEVTKCEFIASNGAKTFKVRFVTNQEGTEFLDARATFDGPEDFFYIDQIDCVEPFLSADADFMC